MGRTPGRGRPPAASRDLLQDAAFELFLENGYARTTVEQIASRAGVSRNTFFNYFDAKSDVFWTEVDAALDGLEALLGGGTAVRDATSPAPVPALVERLLAVAGTLGPARVPWLLTQLDFIDAGVDVLASAVTRFARFTGLVERFLAGHDRAGSPTAATVLAYASAGAAIAAARSWAAAGPARGTFDEWLRRALPPVLDAGAGF